MKLSMSLLYFQLQKNHHISYNHKSFSREAPLKRALYFTGYELSPDYVYVTDCESLERMTRVPDGLRILCLGTPARKYSRCEVIAVCDDDPCQDIHSLLNEAALIFQMYDEWEEALAALACGSQDIGEMFRVSEKILENPCILVDVNFSYMAYSANFFTAESLSILDREDPSSVPLNYVNEFRLDQEFKKLTRKKGVFLYDAHDKLREMLCHNLTYRGRYFARLIMPAFHHPLTEADEHHFAILARFIQKIFDARAESLTFSHRAENVHQLLKTLAIENKPVSGLDIDRILSGSAWRQNSRCLVIYLKLLVSPGITANTAYLCGKIEKMWKGSCTFPYEEGILWILNLDIYRDSHDYPFYDTFACFLRESLCQAGVSNDYNCLDRTALFVQQAKIALEIGGRKNPTHWYHYFKDCALDYMLSQCTWQFPAQELVHPALLLLSRHDAKNHTEYCRTLKSYLENRFSVTDAADALFIHRTTLLHRLKKIQGLCSLDLDDARTIRHLMISFALFDENI